MRSICSKLCASVNSSSSTSLSNVSASSSRCEARSSNGRFASGIAAARSSAFEPPAKPPRFQE
jgi:hypothetical protein